MFVLRLTYVYIIQIYNSINSRYIIYGFVPLYISRESHFILTKNPFFGSNYNTNLSIICKKLFLY
uniref:Photosystem I subunit VIII n=1 Tax=Hansenia oviformis TaxID=1978917 RepID=A0A4D6C1K1_9APIA|nr:photosystem I subunit VIII [Hansenia oviformis]QBX96510.1 photosystem I subunit VIII [Hansenia oviformis]QBX96595.1 photosystem I subunit VIII [Hansenia oviformis]QBX96669.1 photosystem I subunit VIII [Hansenia oviformis]QBX96765.1 photosystem I subunit VIII [Hansenia oviformis]